MMVFVENVLRSCDLYAHLRNTARVSNASRDDSFRLRLRRSVIYLQTAVDPARMP